MAVTKRDYYEVLGIPKTAGADEIKQAFRRLAMRHHPDRNQDNKAAAEERFKEVSEAYEVLSDPAKKQKYDQYGHKGMEGAFGHSGGFRWEDFSHQEDLSDIFGDLGDIFSQFGFGGGGRRGGGPPGSVNGANLEAMVQIELADVLTGKDVPLEFHRHEPCDTCKGSGAKPGTQPDVCSDCRGSGQMQIQQGFFMMATTCRKCRGQGTMIKDKCLTCRGEGRVTQERKLSVKIPAGIESGMRLKLSGEGEGGARGGRRGDLYVRVMVAEHPFFHREGQNLICEVPITMIQASLGAEVKIPTLSGSATAKVPPGGQPGEVLRLRGMGLPGLRGGGRGDQLVQIQVEIPDRLNADQRRLLEQFAQIRDNATFPRVQKFWDQVKRWWKG